MYKVYIYTYISYTYILYYILYILLYIIYHIYAYLSCSDAFSTSKTAVVLRLIFYKYKVSEQICYQFYNLLSLRILGRGFRINKLESNYPYSMLDT